LKSVTFEENGKMFDLDALLDGVWGAMEQPTDLSFYHDQ
jgi:hypothetical protein